MLERTFDLVEESRNEIMAQKSQDPEENKLYE